ncbi:MAG: NTP transferase domain-containing protein [Candidatus Aminicenantes bacterium]|nr:NTP transferase domain-containing protein [Candidatus Aminicenantes bacterium]
MSPIGIDAFILAAGRGMRARPLSLVRPKPLFPLGDVPLIRLLADQLLQAGVDRVFVNLFYRGYEIRRHLHNLDKIRFIEEDSLSGSRILARPRSGIPRPMLVVNGDVFMQIPLDEMRREYKRFACDGVLLVRPRTSASYTAVEAESGWYRRIRQSVHDGDRMYCGAGLFSQRFLSSIRHGSFFQSLEKSAFRVRLLEYRGIWLDLGTPALYHRAQFDYLEYAGLPESKACSGRSHVDDDAILKQCVIWDNVEVGARTCLVQTIVADGVRLSETCMKRRVITPDMNVPL